MGDSDQWQTPQDLFEELDSEFGFDIDLCAIYKNSKCDWWCEDYLKDIVTNCVGEPNEDFQYFMPDKTCFMNPPYSNPKPFIEKAWEDSWHCKIVCLLKVDTSTKWWSVFWNYEKHKPKDGCEVRFFPKRIKFESPSDLGTNGPTFPSCLVIMDRRKVNGID